jgi:hypothetical protein
MPIDPTREFATGVINASTTGCLIEHAFAFGRLLQTAETLLNEPPPPLADIVSLAKRAGDVGLAEPLEVCLPLWTVVMRICTDALTEYTQTGPAREHAMHAVSEAHAPEIDVGGIHDNGSLIVASLEPEKLMAAAAIHKALTWQPPNSGSASAFVANFYAAVAVDGDALCAALALLTATNIRAQLVYETPYTGDDGVP